jgi:urea transport system substrate-binding protein
LLSGGFALAGLGLLAACGAPAPSPTAAPAKPATEPTKPAAAATTAPAAAPAAPSTAAKPTGSADVIKVGILHSLSGTMSISEVSVKDATVLAIEEINKAGGVLDRKLEPVVEDGASDWPTFAEKSKKLIKQDKVAVVFGCWTSASRKAVLPVYEAEKALLFYPVQYEGLEMSPYIFYTGATTNQQIIPGVDYLLEQGKKKIYLLGSDYVFPRTSNTIIKEMLKAKGATLAGEEYTPLGHTDYNGVISKIKAAAPDAIFNTLNGDSNVAFFKQFKDAGFTADKTPVLSVSVAEEEVRGIGPDYVAGHLTSWNYYQTTKTPENEKFVAAYKAKYGDKRVTDDPIEAGYFGVYLWKLAAEKAGSVDVEKIKAAAPGIAFAAPGGKVTIDGRTQHVFKTVRIGKIRPDGLIDEVWATKEPVQPDPYLEDAAKYPWAASLPKPKK